MEVLFLTGFVIPYIVEPLNTRVSNPKLRFVVALAISVLLGVIVESKQVKFASPMEMLQSASLIFAESQVMYHMVFEGSKADEKINALFAAKPNAA